jgi:GNAT superfamily N-acetyltransferase
MRSQIRANPPSSSDELDGLFGAAWPDHQERDFRPILDRALFYVCAYQAEQLIGFAKVVGDGGVHGFLLDPTVAPGWRRRGIGKKLVKACSGEARRKGIEWLHVDYEPPLKAFYNSCGFSTTEAGLLNLKSE